ncbi:MAG: hypothetical protein EBX41_02860 [Chitinophagia bacterium]|nr:hypothetical protein [Chitinophagia bacterium]
MTINLGKCLGATNPELTIPAKLIIGKKEIKCMLSQAPQTFTKSKKETFELTSDFLVELLPD